MHSANMVSARISLRLVFLILVAILTLSCVKTGTVTEKQPLKPIGAGKTVGVVVKNPNPEWQKDADALRQGLVDAIAERKWWKYAEQPDVMIQITLTDFDKGNKAARMFVGTGEAELKGDVEFKSTDGDIL
jgi:hypothetical protein